MKKIEIYTDGACSKNPGEGGWCAILVYKKTEKVISGGEELTTNNRMEMLAVINSLKALKEKCDVTIFSDSAYVVDAINLNWVDEWVRTDWRRKTANPIKNIDLWQELLSLISYQKVKFVKVKGHSDNEYNNRCDKIAVAEWKKLVAAKKPIAEG